ncbi:hypothetical protein L1887_15168 [Cichorium endivia]|nr:hypothetical protein L1887_15168 [Cichorium endivia]
MSFGQSKVDGWCLSKKAFHRRSKSIAGLRPVTGEEVIAGTDGVAGRKAHGGAVARVQRRGVSSPRDALKSDSFIQTVTSQTRKNELKSDQIHEKSQPGLLPLLFWSIQSAQKDHLEVSSILFSSLTVTIGDLFRQYFDEFQAILFKCLQDENSNSDGVAALNAVDFFIELIHDASKVIKYPEIIPNVLNFSRQCLTWVKAIVQFSLEVYSSLKLNSSTHHQTIQIISGLVKYKFSSIKKHEVIIQIFEFATLSSQSVDQKFRGSPYQIAKFLQPEIISNNENVIPSILNALDSDEVDKRHYYASTAFREHIDEEFLLFLGSWMVQLIVVIQPSKRMLQEACLYAIGLVAARTQQTFCIHVERVLELMKSFMVLPNDGDLHPWTRATKQMGEMTMATADHGGFDMSWSEWLRDPVKCLMYTL